MARIRTIKPEFFTSADVTSMSPLARLLYIGLWQVADREGRMKWRPADFKLQVLPSDNCDIQAICQEIIDSGMVVLYGDGLAYIPSFSEHQSVNPRESISKLPEPDGARPAMPKRISKDVRAIVFERDGNRCVRCGSDDHCQLDHILPQSMGGPHIAENLRVLCRPCNAGRPVAGPALDVDLERDGLTINTLRVKLGIDASNPDLRAQRGKEGKGKEEQSIDCSPADGGKAKRKSKLPDDFEATSERLDYARGQGCADPADTFTRFKLHHQSKGTLALDWEKGWQYWCRNESNFRRPQVGKFAPTAGLPTSRDDDAQWRARTRGWRPGRYWNRGDWGPDPSEPGCRVPAAVLTEWRQENMQ